MGLWLSCQGNYHCAAFHTVLGQKGTPVQKRLGELCLTRVISYCYSLTTQPAQGHGDYMGCGSSRNGEQALYLCCFCVTIGGDVGLFSPVTSDRT